MLARFMVALLLVVGAAPAEASAQASVFGPGQEQLVGELLGDDFASDVAEPASLRLPSGCSFAGASIEPADIDARYECQEGSVSLRLVPGRQPGSAPLTVDRSNTDAPDALVRAIEARIALRARDAATTLTHPIAPTDDSWTDPTITWSLLVAGIAAFFFAAVRRGPRPSPLAFARRHLAGGAVILAFVGAASFVPDAGPIHTHRTYLQRSDCAHDPRCDQGKIGWQPPTYHVYAAPFRLLPYRLPTLVGTSLALSTLALLLQYATLVLLGARLRMDAARRFAAIGIAMTAFHPAYLRLAVSTSFWPWAAVCTWAAGAALLRASSPKESRPAAWAVCAAAFLALAVTTSLSMLALAPLLGLVPLSVGRSASRRGLVVSLVALLVAAGFIALSLRDAVPEAAGAAQTLVRPPLAQLEAALRNVIYWTPSLTPVPLGVALLVGLGVALHRFRATFPLLYAFAATELLLGPINAIDYDFPDRLLHGFLSFGFAGTLAALGFVSVEALLERRRPSWARIFAPAMLLATALCLPFTTDATFALLHAPSHTLEARALSAAFDRLPAHDVLILGPTVAEPIDGVGFEGDPIELFFPRGEYDYVASTKGRPAPRVVGIADVLAESAPSFDGALVYVGLGLVSWDPKELEAGLANDGVERPALRRLRDRYSLEPTLTFDVPYVRHPKTLLVPYAGRESSHTLGFFALRRR